MKGNGDKGEWRGGMARGMTRCNDERWERRDSKMARDGDSGVDWFERTRKRQMQATAED